MNSENSKTSDLHRLLLNLLDKINLERSDKYVALSNLSIYYRWKNIKMPYKNNKFKISAPTWNEQFPLPDGSYSVPDIQDYFKYNFKKHDTVTDNPSIVIYINKIENRIGFKRKTGYYFELLTPEIIKLLGSPKSKITEVVLIHCNIFSNHYQQNSRVLYTFVPGQLLDISR